MKIKCGGYYSSSILGTISGLPYIADMVPRGNFNEVLV